MDISKTVKIMLAVRCGRCEPEKTPASLDLPLDQISAKKELQANRIFGHCDAFMAFQASMLS